MITNSTPSDIDEIFRLYNLASEYQKTRFHVVWPEFEQILVETEIKENRQFKLLIDGKIACIFAITFNDPQIWEEKDNSESIYIHRIATNPEFRGSNFVKIIVEWAKEYCKEHYKTFIRMDTIGENKKLIEHYTLCGFEYLGYIKLKSTEGLPAHYQYDDCCLFEIDLKKQI